ncbi:sec1 family domain-containing protein 1 [Daktulosphaira vitifoliae]|uniref:sec1 family domain-containing protein 1 n=1 Tax=Daktulosphaira vitifoliae TaxID=58002 RepID=UPI0021AA57A2|nr:sec1 family domain-containing protein 1 [Daktulosphaira vitifoliae]
MASVRDKQISALKEMLNLNSSDFKDNGSEPVWKVLIYDRRGQDILSPLIPIKELRECGVTLHLNIHSERDPIPDVAAIYFCMPDQENLDRIAQDFQNNVYEKYYLNFISAISRQKLEDLASSALQTDNVNQVNRIFDQYLNFISLEDELFVLNNQNNQAVSYYNLNRADAKDTDVEVMIDDTVDGLYSVFATLGTLPIIRSARGNAAEMVAEKLDKKLRENLRDTRNSLFSSESSGVYNFQRPLLIVLDRNVDMATPLHHTWTYQALVHDVLKLNLNRVTVTQEQKKPKTFDLDPKDSFWVTHKGSPFPTVAESIQSELEQLKNSEEEVKQLKESMGLDGESDVALAMMTDNTAKLTSAVNNLPQLLEKKRLIDMHTDLATSILSAIKSRRLDLLFEFEEKVMSQASLDKQILDVINDPEAGTAEDKMRLFIIYYIYTHTISDLDMDMYLSELEKQGCDLSPLKYIKRWKMYSNITSTTNQYGGGTKSVNMFEKLLSHTSSFVMEGVKNLVVKRHTFPVTRILDELLENKQSSGSSDEFRHFDPKQLRNSDNFKTKNTFNEAIIFIVGGGNYIEYQNLLEYIKNKTVTPGMPTLKIVYGSTVINNAPEFLEQLSLLGKELQ